MCSFSQLDNPTGSIEIPLNYFKQYIISEGIFDIKEFNENIEEHNICKKVAQAVRHIYIQNRTLDATAEILKVKYGLFRKFLIEADRLKFINLKEVKALSKTIPLPLGLTRGIIREFVKSKQFYKACESNKDSPIYILSKSITEYITRLFISYKTTKKVARKINIKQHLLGDFLLISANLGFLDREIFKGIKLLQTIIPLMKKGLSLEQISGLIGESSDNIKYTLEKEIGNINQIRKELGIISPKRLLLLTKAKDAYERCDTIEKVCQELKLSKSYVMALLKKGNKLGLLKYGKNKRTAPENLLKIKELYDQCGTLEKVGRELNITRERVRQLLNIGVQKGFFKYEISSKKRLKDLRNIIRPDILIQEINTSSSIQEICEKLDIKRNEFGYLLDYFKIDYLESLNTIKDNQNTVKRKKCLEEYTNIVNILGHHPATTEMNSRKDWHSTCGKINRLWNGIDNFRKEFGIEKPKHSLPVALRRVIKEKHVIKAQNKEKVLNFIKAENPVKAITISESLGLNRAQLAQYIHELLSENLIIRIGGGRSVKYATNNDNA